MALDAEKGAEAILKTIGEIYRIKESSQEAVSVISSLGSRIEAIGQIVNVIDDVAEQTNLLALNAAIIAAQAGEQGKGFAVVADEIKDLAERAGASTREITDLIKTVQAESKNAITAVERGAHNVDRGVEVSNEAERALKKILESSQKSTNMVRAIARATVEQAKGSKQVTDAIGRIAETVQQIAAATAQQARGSELIMRSAEKMRIITQHVERSSQEQARRPAARSRDRSRRSREHGQPAQLEPPGAVAGERAAPRRGSPHRGQRKRPAAEPEAAHHGRHRPAGSAPRLPGFHILTAHTAFAPRTDDGSGSRVDAGLAAQVAEIDRPLRDGPAAEKAALLVDGEPADLDAPVLVLAVGEDVVAEGGVEDVAATGAEEDGVDPVFWARADEGRAGGSVGAEALEEQLAVRASREARRVAELGLDGEPVVVRAPANHAGRAICGEGLDASELRLVGGLGDGDGADDPLAAERVDAATAGR